MHTRASNSELVEPLLEPERTLNRRSRRRNRRVPFDQRNNTPKNLRIVYPPILDINHFRHFLVTLENLYPMDDEPMWAANHVVASTPSSAITIPETANEFAIKALFDRLLREIRAFSQHENESLTDAWLCMKEMLRNCHGHNLSKGNIIKIFYHGLSEITQEVLNAAAGGIFLYKTPNQAYQLLEDKVLLKLDWAKNQKTKPSLKKTVAFADEGSSNSNTNKIIARMDAMTLKMDAQYKELQTHAKKTKLDLDEDDIPMSREEEAKFMKTFCKPRFYNDYRDRDSNRNNWRSNERSSYNRDNYRSNTDDKSYDLQKQFNNFMKSQQSTNVFVKETFMDLKTQLETVAKNHQSSIQNLETKFDRLADKQYGRPSGSLPSNTQPNPKGHNSKAYQPPQSRNEHVNVVFTKSGKSYNPPVNSNDQQTNFENPINFNNSDEEDKEPTPQPQIQNPKPVKETTLPKTYKPKFPYPQRLRKEKMEAQYGKFLDVIHAVRINVPLIDFLAGMPNYGKFLKELLSNKHKIKQIFSAFLSDESSTMIQNKVPPKLEDPESFLIPCNFNKTFSCNALADLGASINLMPYSLYAKLSLENLKPTKMSVRLANKSFQYPVEIAKNLLIEVGKFTFLGDFVILKMEEDSKVPLILGRPFLHTTDAVIRVKQKQLNLRVGTKRMIFNIDSAMKHSYSNDDTCFIIDIIDEILKEDFDALLDESSKILHSSEGTLLEEEIFAKFDEFMAMTADENSDSESDTKDPPFEKITINTDYKIKTSLKEPPMNLKLKPLPDNLEYVFLEEPSFLPVIISSQLSKEKKNKLIFVVKKHKQAFAWKTTDIPGICPSFYKHKIQLLDDKKAVIQKQRRLNPNMQEVVKKEIVKLLDTGIIYPIADSPWVSPIHCVPKKGGITVVTNENDELVPTRTITGWRVCIDYRKLNEATAKDHFPLPFMDQMLERLAGNKYFCFLDGFSGYFQIPIDPNDQEKTTFTCPFGTYAYRRMPFGLCNAPATFQRCMLAIFHDMIEESVEVFMDDFSVFGNSFDTCLNNLDKMLQRCKDAHLVLNWEKCHFMVKEGIVLGHKVSSAGLEVDKAKIDVISKLPPPTNIKGVRSFLGHAGFYRRFIKDFSKIARPITKLLEKDTPFEFDDECQKAFESLKEKLTCAPVIVSPNWNLPFELMCDASDFAVGAVLGQKDVVVDYVSKWAEAQALPTNDGRVVVAFLKKLFCRFGMPKALISDRVVKLKTRTGLLKEFLKKIVKDNPAIWSRKLDDALWAFRTAYKTPTGTTPYKLIYGKNCHLPFKIEHRAYWALKNYNPDLIAAGEKRMFQLHELDELRYQAYENSRLYKERTKVWHDRKL
ncbi:reverse transcriptase domain-containing protein [Tanacetum coccineum]